MTWKDLFWPGVVILALTAWTGGEKQAGAQSQDQSSATQSASGSSQPSPSPASGQASSPQASATPASMQPAEVPALLYKIYTANFRVGDLTGALPIDQWKLTDEDAASLRQKADALRASVAALEKARNDFYNHPDDAALGQATASALQSLLPQIEDCAKALESTRGASFAKDYEQALGDLRKLDQQIEPYIASLQAKNQPPPGAPSAAVAAQNPAPTQAAQAPTEAQAEKAQTQPPAAQNPSPSETNQAQATVPSAQPAQPQAPPEAPPSEALPHPGVTPAAMPKADAQAVLYKLYAANFRVGDLTGSLGIDQWKLSDQDRSALSQKAETLRTSVATLEKARAAFYNSPEDVALGQGTTAAIQSLLPKIDEFAAALRNTPGASNANDYQQSAADLRALDSKLEPYVAYLDAKNQPPAPTGAGNAAAVETEVIKPAVAPPPLTVVAPEKSPLSNDQLRTLLYQAYVPAFRIKDLLGQEQPEHWKIPDAERTVYADASQALAKRLADLASWRDQLEAHPDSLEAAFEVYAALDKVDEPAGIVGHMVSQYEDPKLGAEYLEKSRQVAEFRNQVEPYVGYLLRRHDQAIGTVERNFVTCETELTSVMRPTTVAAEPMKNVLPVFRGRGRTVTRGAGSGKASAHSSKKNSAGKPAPSNAKPAPSGAKPAASGAKPAPSKNSHGH